MGKNWISRHSLVLLLSLAIFLWPAPTARPARAQTQTPTTGPEYIIESGDTLYYIAARFGTTVEALLAANPGVNPNALTIGGRLIIPGYENFSGTLKIHEVGNGETIDSIARALRTPPADLTRLNRIVNTRTIYLGQPIVYPEANAPDGPMGGERLHLLPEAGTLLGLAAATGSSPWALATLNGLADPELTLGGGAIIVPEPESPGAPTGLPAPFTSFTVIPPAGVQGRTLEIKVKASEPVTLTGVLSSFGALAPPEDLSPQACRYPIRTLHFAVEANAAIALQGLCALAAPGVLAIDLTATDEAGNEATFSQLVPLREGDYGRELLTVPPETLDSAAIQREVNAIRAVATGFTSDRLWEGVFQSPSEYGEYRSYFGTRRSYNGGPFDSFHTGLDYSGQTGTPVLAPAPGVVVLTEPNFIVYGGVTFIDHGWGVYTGYLHQSKIEVAVGDHVVTGQEIGQVGNTGRVTGPHLHWEVWVGSVVVDPLDWLKRSFP